MGLAGPATGIASSDDLYGVIVDWGVVPGGFYIFPVDLSGTNLGFPLPRNGNGSSSLVWLTVDGSGNIAPLGATQYAYQAFNNCMPTRRSTTGAARATSPIRERTRPVRPPSSTTTTSRPITIWSPPSTTTTVDMPVRLAHSGP